MYKKKRRVSKRRGSQAITTTLKQGFKTKTGRIHMLEGAVFFGVLTALSGSAMGAFSYLNGLGVQLKEKAGM